VARVYWRYWSLTSKVFSKRTPLRGLRTPFGNRTSPAIRNASDGEGAVPDSRDDVARHESQPRTRENIQSLERELRIVNEEILEFETRL
jgi:hypothetical protein